MKGEGTVYYPHPLTSCLATKMLCSEKSRGLRLKESICAGGNMSLSYAAV
jgi:hypothetical protein